jgi:hypothetical protein
MIRAVLPALPPTGLDGNTRSRSQKLLALAARMLTAEAWQTAAALDGFPFDPSAIPSSSHSFTTAAGSLARALHGCCEALAEEVPRTIDSDGATETTWPNRSGVRLFVVDTPADQRHVYLAASGFITARFPRRQVQVSRFGRYTTGVLGGRTARAVAELLENESLEPQPPLLPWPVDPRCETSYSVLSRTMLALTRTLLAATAPDLRARLDAIDFDEPMRDAIANLTVDAVHAF